MGGAIAHIYFESVAVAAINQPSEFLVFLFVPTLAFIDTVF